jgi:hypothetical protein
MNHRVWGVKMRVGECELMCLIGSSRSVLTQRLIARGGLGEGHYYEAKVNGGRT